MGNIQRYTPIALYPKAPLYKGRNTNVYACLLDATKAFDCVRYDKLFELLLKKDIPGTVIRLLLGKGG